MGQRLLIDLDGVLADFDLGFVRVWQALGGARPLVAPAARRHFHLRDDYPAAWRDAVTATIAQPGFYRQLLPMPGAQAVLAQLAPLPLPRKPRSSSPARKPPHVWPRPTRTF